MQSLLIFSLLTLSFSRTYPLYKQCDPKWGNDQLGNTTTTLCKSGSAVSSVAMALTSTNH